MYSKQLQKNIMGAIFDMDGLLVDSESLYYKASAAVIKQDNLPIPKEAYLKIKGYSSREFKKFYLNYIDQPTFDSFITKTNQFVDYSIASDHLRLMTGAKNLLKKLSQSNVKLALASNNYRKFIVKVLKQLDVLDYFDVILCHDDVQSPKPDPSIYKSAQQKLKIDYQDLVVFEDAGPGLQAADSLNITTVLVPNLRDATLKERQLATIVLPSLADFD